MRKQEGSVVAGEYKPSVAKYLKLNLGTELIIIFHHHHHHHHLKRG